MPKVSVDIPQQLLDDLNCHVGVDRKFVSQSDAIRTAIRKLLDRTQGTEELKNKI
jgi:Arc/MetJ-type ribon-helix-helix transcriptional regulator